MKHKSFNTKVGSKLLRFRRHRGFSQQDLSLTVGINRTYLARIEEGKANPTILLLARILKELGLDVYAFFKDL